MFNATLLWFIIKHLLTCRLLSFNICSNHVLVSLPTPHLTILILLSYTVSV